jgi:hypothetical protein
MLELQNASRMAATKYKRASVVTDAIIETYEK